MPVAQNNAVVATNVELAHAIQTPEVPGQEPVVSSPSENKVIDEMDFIKNLLEGDKQDFGKLLQELMQSNQKEALKKEIEKRSRMLQSLPVDLREHIDSLAKAYQEFTKSLKLESCVAALCQKLRLDLDALVLENTQFKEDLLASLNELYRALNDGSFAHLVQPEKLPGNPLDLQNFFMQVLRQTAQAQQEQSNFNEESLKKMIEQLTTLNVVLIHDEQLRNQQGMRDEAEGLLLLLKLAEQKDTKKLSKLCVDFVRPDYIELSQKIKTVIGLLADAHIQCTSQSDSGLKEALEYWLKQVNVYRQTLNSFFSLVSSTTFDVSPLLRAASNFYEIVSIVFQAHRYKVFGAYNWSDLALRSAIGFMAYFQRSNQEATQAIQKYVLGDGDLAQFTNPLNQIEYKIVSAVNIVPFMLWNPTSFADR